MARRKLKIEDWWLGSGRYRRLTGQGRCEVIKFPCYYILNYLLHECPDIVLH